MKIKKEYAILFFIIAVLVFYIYSEKGQKTHYELPAVKEIDEDKISRLNIIKKGAEITLIKENDNWLIGPRKFPADASHVGKLLEEVVKLQLTALVSESRNYSIYELDDDSGIEVMAYDGDEIVRRIKIGKPASSYRHTFVMLRDDHRVYHAEGNIRSEFDKTVSELRDKEVMSFSDEIYEMTMKKDGEELKIIKESSPVSDNESQKKEEAHATESPATGWSTGDGKPVKSEQVNEIINTLSDFECDEFIDDKKKDDFSAPIYTIILKGLKTHSISLFEKKDNKYPAISSESEYPFLLSEWKANKIMKDFSTITEMKE